jgi:hypothetical protein
MRSPVRTALKSAAVLFILAAPFATVGTAHADTPIHDPVGAISSVCDRSVDTVVYLAQPGMRINPCADLDTTQVQDDRAGAASSDMFYLVGDADVSPATWRDLAAMDYSHPMNRPLPARDHMLIVWYGGTELALDRIHSGINR